MAFLLWLSLVSVLLGFSGTVRGAGSELPCRLVWSLVDNKDNLPGNLVASHPAEQFVIRGTFLSRPNDYVVGRLDGQTKDFFLPFLGGSVNETVNSIFEILTNPEGCTVEWKTVLGASLPEFPVSANEYSTTDKTSFVGRHLEGGLWFGGHVKVDEGQIYVPRSQDPTDGTAVYPRGAFDVLVSYSEGITMDMTEFVMDSDIFGGNADFVGMDEIHNGGPGSISLNIEHKKTVIETYEIEIRKETTTKYTSTVKILFWKIKKTWSHTEVSVERKKTVETTEMTVSHQVDVPPFSSVQACSMIKMSEEKEVGYTAWAQYLAKGMTGDEVAALLLAEGIETSVVNGVAGRSVSGQLAAQMALNTEFVVVDFDSRMGCSALALKSSRAKTEALRKKNLLLQQRLYQQRNATSHYNS